MGWSVGLANETDINGTDSEIKRGMKKVSDLMNCGYGNTL